MDFDSARGDHPRRYALGRHNHPSRSARQQHARCPGPGGRERFRTIPNGSCYNGVVSRIQSDEVRIPRHAREAVARHETVLVLNRERPVLALVHPDDIGPSSHRHGRPVSAVAADLATLPEPDPEFASDMSEVLRLIGPPPEDPWARS